MPSERCQAIFANRGDSYRCELPAEHPFHNGNPGAPFGRPPNPPSGDHPFCAEPTTTPNAPPTAPTISPHPAAVEAATNQVSVGLARMERTLTAAYAADPRLQALVGALELCDHKITQTLEGQYPQGQALEAAREYGREVLAALSHPGVEDG